MNSIDLDRPELYTTDIGKEPDKVLLTIHAEECEVLDRYGIDESKWVQAILMKEAFVCAWGSMYNLLLSRKEGKSATNLRTIRLKSLEIVYMEYVAKCLKAQLAIGFKGRECNL